MTLRPEYALGHSAYNDFLFATIGVEVNNTYSDGRDLTVLSALARLQIDPWHEAARLADLPRGDACRALIGTLGGLTDVRWTPIDLASTAQRLVALLPDAASPPGPFTPEAAAANHATPSAPPTIRKSRSRWLVWAVLAVATVAITLQLQPDNNLEPSHGSSTNEPP